MSYIKSVPEVDIPSLLSKQVTMIDPPMTAEWNLPRLLERVYLNENEDRMVFVFAMGYYQVYGLVDVFDYDGTSRGKSLNWQTLTICYDDLKLLTDAGLLDPKVFDNWVTFQKQQFKDMKHEGMDVLFLFRTLMNIE